MKTRTILTFVMCLSLVIGLAQQNDPPIDKTKAKPVSGTDNPAGSGAGSSSGLMAKYSLGEECSMYLNENFQKGTLTLKDNTVFDDRLYRFNIYTQQMEFILNSDTAAIGNPEEIRLLQFDGKNFTFAEYDYDQKVSKGYLEVLVDGDYKLLLRCCVKYTLREDTEDPNAKPVEKYYQEKNYFMASKNEPAKHILLNKKDVINSVKVPGKDLKEYMKKRNIQMKSESDLVEVFRYCNASGRK